MTLPLCRCGATAVLFRPGSEPIYTRIVRTLVARDVPTSGRCLDCWIDDERTIPINCSETEQPTCQPVTPPTEP